MTTVASVINALISAIPVAQDGDVISKEYHNSLRAALAALAARDAGGGSAGEPVALTLAPAFLPNAGGPNWELTGGVATRPADAATGGRLGSAHGWMPLQLPDGARLQSMSVFGRRAGTISVFTVILSRRNILEQSNLPLISVQLREAEETFERSATPSGAAGGAPIDNRTFNYFITARLVGAGDPEDVAEIDAIRLIYQPA